MPISMSFCSKRPVILKSKEAQQYQYDHFTNVDHVIIKYAETLKIWPFIMQKQKNLKVRK